MDAPAHVYCFVVLVLTGAQACQPDRGDLQADVGELQQMMAKFAKEMEDMKTTMMSAFGGLSENSLENKRQLPRENGDVGLTEQTDTSACTQGLRGPPGRDGRDGAPGRDGAAARDGQPEPQGLIGEKGDIGPEGPPGEKVETGADGDGEVPCTSAGEGPPVRMTPTRHLFTMYSGDMDAPVYCLFVLVLAGSQAFQPDRGDLQADVDEVQQMMAKMLKMEMEDLKTTILTALGSVYIRWGRTTCPNIMGTSLIYDGIAGGTHYTHSGGGANYVCLPKDPEWGVFTEGNQGPAYMQGAEYEVSEGNNPFQGASLHDHDVPCAVCHVASRGSKLMIPARLSCPSGWTREYNGYLMTERHSHYRSEFVCMDGEPEARPGGHVNNDGALFYPVEADCGALPCPNYVQGRELTCVVCTK